MSISIGSYTLVNPSDEDIEYILDGSSYLLASAEVQHDNWLGTPKRIISLSWRAISESQKDDIVSAYTALFSSNLSYTDIRNDTFDITIPESRDRLKVTTVARGIPVYNVSIKIKEVLT